MTRRLPLPTYSPFRGPIMGEYVVPPETPMIGRPDMAGFRLERPCPPTDIYGDDTDCGHVRCVQVRRIAASPCEICGEEIGIGPLVYQIDDWARFEHVDCQPQPHPQGDPR